MADPTRSELARVAAAVLLLPGLLAWPLPRVFTTELLTAHDREAPTHLWGLWAALQEGDPLVVTTTLVRWPEGSRLVLVDPLHLLPFALGDLINVAAAYNLLFYLGFVTMGLAGALLARRLDGAPWLGAVAAMCTAGLVSSHAAGMTEEFGVGWVGLQLAALLSFVERGGLRRGLVAALALSAAWYSGPYNGLWASLLNLGVGLPLVARGGPGLRRALSAGGLAAALTLPLAWAVLTQRPPGLPGTTERAGLPDPLPDVADYRGGLWYGVDATDLWAPTFLTGDAARTSHTGYLGLLAIGLAVVAVAQDRRRWPWLAGAAVLAGLALGPYLTWKGHILTLPQGTRLLTPLGYAIAWVPDLGRYSRWYRAAPVAGLLLAPLIATVPRRAWLRALVAGGLVAETLTLAPMAWPLLHTPLPAPIPTDLLVGEGALLELPAASAQVPAGGAWRDVNLLLQPGHGRPIAGSLHGEDPSAAGREASRLVRILLRQGGYLPAGHRAVQDAGFRWLAVYPQQEGMPPQAREHLRRCLGAPLVDRPELWLYDLEHPRLPCTAVDP